MTVPEREPWLDEPRVSRVAAVLLLSALALGVWWPLTGDPLVGGASLLLVLAGGLLMARADRTDSAERRRVGGRS